MTFLYLCLALCELLPLQVYCLLAVYSAGYGSADSLHSSCCNSHMCFKFQTWKMLFAFHDLIHELDQFAWENHSHKRQSDSYSQDTGWSMLGGSKKPKVGISIGSECFPILIYLNKHHVNLCCPRWLVSACSGVQFRAEIYKGFPKFIKEIYFHMNFKFWKSFVYFCPKWHSKGSTNQSRMTTKIDTVFI